MSSEPRYLCALARDHLAEAKAKMLAGSVPAGSTASWVLLFEVAEAASVLMADRAATLHALAYVHALGRATGGDPSRETDDDGRRLPHDDDAMLVGLNYEGTTDASEELRIVDAARMLADECTIEGFSTSEDAARSCLTSHGLSRDDLAGKVVRLRPLPK